jgi:uncharacterized DUF497 family protein
MDIWERLSACTGFDWDEGNTRKIWEKHRVSSTECEQFFLNRPLIISPDESHSLKEDRFYALGQTDNGRPLFVIFTLRGDLIRAISARDMNRKEREVYRRS